LVKIRLARSDKATAAEVYFRESEEGETVEKRVEPVSSWISGLRVKIAFGVEQTRPESAENF